MGAGSNQNYKNAVTVNMAPLKAHLHFGKKRTLGLQEFLFPVVSRIKAQGLLESGVMHQYICQWLLWWNRLSWSWKKRTSDRTRTHRSKTTSWRAIVKLHYGSRLYYERSDKHVGYRCMEIATWAGPEVIHTRRTENQFGYPAPSLVGPSRSWQDSSQSTVAGYLPTFV